MTCPKCQAGAPDNNRFCELCGCKLISANKIEANVVENQTNQINQINHNHCRCGAPPEAFDSQGYCLECGIRRAPRQRIHNKVELLPNFAAVTDQGLRHSSNEDAVVIDLKEINGKKTFFLVVCDGLSTAQRSAEAAKIAAKEACESLKNGLCNTLGQNTKAIMLDAIKKAHSAICKLEYLENDPQDPPGTTIVAAVVQNLMVTIGWVGDSRAYWVGQANAGLLTRDHSWVNRVVDCGEMTEEEALRSAQAHEITQCIGPLETIISGQEPTASLNTFLLTPSSFLLLCSDGVWNYAPTANEFAKVVQQSPSFEALTICEVLVANAMSLGGRDNATVAVLCV